MSIKVTYDCCGCEASATVILPGAFFLSITGRSYGLGTVQYPRVRDHVPEGWMDYDPYTYLTYCPDCVASIWPEEEKSPAPPAYPGRGEE